MSGSVNARYILNEVDSAIEFYIKMLDFKVGVHPAPEFGIVSRGDIRLYLAEPSEKGEGGQAMPDGAAQTLGGWNIMSRKA